MTSRVPGVEDLAPSVVLWELMGALEERDYLGGLCHWGYCHWEAVVVSWSDSSQTCAVS